MSQVFNILIIEDQKEQRFILKNILGALDGDYNIYCVSSVEETLALIKKKKFNLFFIDIGLPDGSGLDLAKKIRNMPLYELTWIVFLTTFKDHILDAFKETHCYDYIIKPYKKEQILDIAKKLIRNTSINNSNLDNEKYISFKLKNIVLKIRLSDIIFIEVYKKNCSIHTHNQIHKIKRTSLKKILKMLPYKNFIQCHRSYAINLNHVDKIQKNNNTWDVFFVDYPEKAILGGTYKKNVIDNFQKYFSHKKGEYIW
ncbi:LytR/AlgR family response regulator transcription factor [Dethiothermospora halolimnae]|uniref:LytR/AlgR family response regulator transcription factor n=1 Tax=Dethiothermospora halolimnae TaxID=3114390 RepID=UPI003CCC15C1